MIPTTIATKLFVTLTILLLVGSIIHLLKQKRSTSKDPEHFTDNQIGRIILLAIVVFLSGFKTYQSYQEDVYNYDFPIEQARVKKEVEELSKIVPPTVTSDTLTYEQVASNRNTLIYNLKQIDPTLAKFEAKTINYNPCFQAVDLLNNKIMIFGNETHIKQIEWIHTLPKEGKLNGDVYLKILSFAGLVSNAEGSKWVSDELNRKTSKPVTDSTNINHKEILFLCDHEKITISISNENK